MTEAIHIEDRGEGMAVILLHGTPTAPAHMRPLAQRLAGAYRTLLVHNPGAGESPSLAPYDLARSNALIAESLAARGVHEAAFIGMSGGCHRAAAIARTSIVTATGFVLLSPILSFPPDKAAQLRDLARGLRSGADLSAPMLDIMLTARGRNDLRAVADVAGWVPGYASVDALADELDAFADQGADLRDFVGSLHVPVLLRGGSEDLATPVAVAQELAGRIPGATLEVVEDQAHALLTECFDPTAQSIERFLSSLRG